MGKTCQQIFITSAWNLIDFFKDIILLEQFLGTINPQPISHFNRLDSHVIFFIKILSYTVSLLYNIIESFCFNLDLVMNIEWYKINEIFTKHKLLSELCWSADLVHPPVAAPLVLSPIYPVYLSCLPSLGTMGLMPVGVQLSVLWADTQ